VENLSTRTIPSFARAQVRNEKNTITSHASQVTSAIRSEVATLRADIQTAAPLFALGCVALARVRNDPKPPMK